jgi:hypothetical protein
VPAVYTEQSASSPTGTTTVTVAATGLEAASSLATLPACDNPSEKTSLGLGIGLGVGIPLLIALVASLVLLRRGQHKIKQLEQQGTYQRYRRDVMNGGVGHGQVKDPTYSYTRTNEVGGRGIYEASG